MNRKLLLSALFGVVLTLALVTLAQDTGGEMDDMTGGMMTGGDMTGGMMTGGMSEADAEMDAMLESLMSSSMTGGDMTGGMMDTSSMTIAEVVAANPDFGILAQLVQAAGLLETLDGEGPFTVFAPSDDAFLPFTNNEIVSLLGDTDALTNVLTYHVVDGEMTSEDLMDMSSVTTLQGGDLTVGEGMVMRDMSSSDMTGGSMTGGMMDGGDMMDSSGMAEGMSEMSGGDMTGGMMDTGTGLTVNGTANIVSADIETSNGVIHVIDAVLMPSN